MEHPFSIWSSFDITLSPEDMVLAMERRGLTVCELSDEHAAVLLGRDGTPEEVGGAFKAYADAHRVSFPQGHLWLQVRLCDTSTDVVGILDRWLRLFGAVGIRNAVLHCDRASFPKGTDAGTIYDANAAVLKRLVPTAEACGVRICLENLGGCFSDAESLLSIIDRVGSPALGICLDTGHLNLNHPEAQEHFILTAGSRLHALHIADNDTTCDQHLIPFGRGNVNWDAVMSGLRQIGYCDLFNYEIPGERLCPIGVRDAKAVYLRAVTDALYAL